MKCEDIKELIIEYIDGSLENKDVRLVDEHLSSCEACRKEVADMKSIWSKLDDIEMEEPSQDLEKNFNKMIDSYSLGMNNRGTPWHETISKWLESWWPRRPLTQFATTFAVLIIGLVVGLNINHRTESIKEIDQIKTGVNQIQQVVITQ